MHNKVVFSFAVGTITQSKTLLPCIFLSHLFFFKIDGVKVKYFRVVFSH